jgi:hypothetical protein
MVILGWTQAKPSPNDFSHQFTTSISTLEKTLWSKPTSAKPHSKVILNGTTVVIKIKKKNDKYSLFIERSYAD